MSVVVLKNLQKQNNPRTLQANVDLVFDELTQQQWDEMEPFITGEGKEGSINDDWHAVVILFRTADVNNRLKGAPSAKIKPRLKKTFRDRGMMISKAQRITGHLPATDAIQ